MRKLLIILTMGMFFASTVHASQKPTYQDNFYKAVNQEWINANPIPADKQSITAFSHIVDLLNQRFSEMLHTLKKQKNRTADEQRLLDFYSSFMDVKERNKRGITPLKAEFDAITSLKNPKDLVHQFAAMPKFSLTASRETPFVFGIAGDDKNASVYMNYLSQGGITLEKKYYESNSSEAVKKRKNYLDYTTALLKLAQIDKPKEVAKSNLRVETALAKISWTAAQSSDPKKTHNPMDFKGLSKLVSNLDMPYFFKQRGYPESIKINVSQPSYFEALNTLVLNIPLEDWKNYLRVRVLIQSVDYLSEAFTQAKQAYNVMEGLSSKLAPLDTRAVEATNYNVAYLFGHVYVKKFFDEKNKVEAEKILQKILNEYQEAIKKTTRFDDATKKAALKKIEKMHFDVAYPKVWHDYGNTKLDASDLIGNLKTLDRLDKSWDSENLKRGTVNKALWDMPPHFVNANYDPTLNKFNLFAAILNPPFYEANASDAANYAGIGHVIGHEIGHAFDNWGANYDENGEMKNWWSKKDLEKFNQLKDALIKQADAYEILPGVTSNGEIEIGEIMADLSGAEIALAAYLKTLDENTDKKEATRAFFIHLAKVWKANTRKEKIIQLNNSNPHPADVYRINGTVRNMDAFYEAFDVKKGDKMYLAPEKRVQLWPK